MRETTARGVERSGAGRESSNLNMAFRLELAVEERAGQRERKTKCGQRRRSPEMKEREHGLNRGLYGKERGKEAHELGGL